MEAHIDTAFDAFKRLVPELQTYQNEDLSESDTRSKVIDPILELLGWRESAIRRESHEREEGKYLDYKLSTTQPVFLVEAKKQYITFDLPSGGARFYRISGAISKSKDLYAAIQQVRQYAYNSGIVFCCATNGFQFVFFRASNSAGIAWDRHLAVVFRDHQEILNRFPEFYELFAYESVASGKSGRLIPIEHLPANSSTRFHNFGSELKLDYESRDRNVLFPYTRELIKNVFQSLENDEASPDLLEHCYVESARDSSYERGIGELLKEHRTKLPVAPQKIETGKKEAGKFQAHFKNQAAQAKAGGSVTLLLGTLGAGKTTFLNRFRKVFAKEIIDEKFIWIYLSFNGFVESEDSLTNWLSSKLKAALDEYSHLLNPFSWDSLQKIYDREIRELRDGMLNPYYRADRAQYEIKLSDELRAIFQRSENHLLRCLHFFSTETKRNLILVFDNADQHSPSLQNQVFLVAQKYSESLRCMAFISLREESYWKNKDFGGLSAFHATSFQITAPRIEQILAKRFKYATKVIADDHSLDEGGFTAESLQLSKNEILLVFKTLQNSILGSDKRFIQFIEYTSPGEVRRALDCVSRFLTSGHTNINRIMDRAYRGQIEPVPFHEFLQAVLLGDRVHYQESISDVVNIFTVEGQGDQSHFNRLAVLSRILSELSEHSTRGKGFVPTSEVIEDCEAIGISADTTTQIIGTLIQKRLLLTDTLIRDQFDEKTHVRASSSALYYIKDLAKHFTYIDLVLIDTQIGQDNVRQKLIDLSRIIYSETDRYKRLETRIERTKVFISYLESEFNESAFAKSGVKFDKAGKEFIPALAGC